VGANAAPRSVQTWLAECFAPAVGELGHRALYRTFQQGIRSGVPGAGSRLPASREIANARRIARNTVVHVYAQLAQ
jgi:hypothetical protein